MIPKKIDLTNCITVAEVTVSRVLVDNLINLKPKSKNDASSKLVEIEI